MRARFFWIGATVVVLIAVVGLVSLKVWVDGWLRGPEFRELIEVRTSAAMRADVTLDPLQWAGSSVYSARLEALGNADAPLKSLAARQLRGSVDWRAIFDGAWRIERIDVVRLDAEWRGNGVRRDRSEPAVGAQSVPRGRSFFDGWLPRRFEVGEVAVQSANLAVEGVGSLRETELTARPEGSGWVFDGSGGQIDWPRMAGVEIEDFRLRLQQGILFVTDASLRAGEAGRIGLSGEVGSADRPVALRAEWTQVDCSAFLDTTWRERLRGKSSGNADFTGGGGDPLRSTGRFVVTDGSLEGLPVQAQIAKFARSPQFERMPIHELSGDFVIVGGDTVIRNFVLESKGLLKVAGDLRVRADRTLDGTFRIGVTSQTLRWLPGSRERIFTESRDGYLWTDLRVGGTMDDPTENLSTRLAQATADEVIETGVELINDVPGKARETVKDIYDLFAPLLQ